MEGREEKERGDKWRGSGTHTFWEKVTPLNGKQVSFEVSGSVA